MVVEEDCRVANADLDRFDWHVSQSLVLCTRILERIEQLSSAKQEDRRPLGCLLDIDPDCRSLIGHLEKCECPGEAENISRAQKTFQIATNRLIGLWDQSASQNAPNMDHFSEVEEHWRATTHYLKVQIKKAEQVLGRISDARGKSSGGRKVSPGRPKTTDEAEDARILDAWTTGGYKKYAELARDLGGKWTGPMVRSTVDRAKKRQKKATD